MQEQDSLAGYFVQAALYGLRDNPQRSAELPGRLSTTAHQPAAASGIPPRPAVAAPLDMPEQWHAGIATCTLRADYPVIHIVDNF